jgi:cytochrome subunit of sulfide dehydrogenase
MARDRRGRRAAMRALAAFAATLLAAAAAVAQDEPSGQAMVQTCYVCHGPEGRSAEAVPALMRGQKEFVMRQMIEFKTDRRPATIMNRVAKSYSDEQIATIADYLAALK